MAPCPSTAACLSCSPPTRLLLQGLEDEQCSVRVVDDSTFDSLASLALEPYELGCSLGSACLGEDKAPYYVVSW